MKTKLLILLALFVLPMFSVAQVHRFHNPVVAPLFFNPGFAGMTDHQRLSLAYHNEYPSIGISTHLVYASWDQLSSRLKGAIGAEVWHENYGPINTTRVLGLYSPKINLGSKWTFSPALKMGYQRTDYDLMPTWGTQTLNHHGLNFNPGILLNTSNFYLGVASDNLLRVTLREERDGPIEYLPTDHNWNLQTGYRFQPGSRSRWSLSATGLVVLNSSFATLNAQLIYNRKWLILGFGGDGIFGGNTPQAEVAFFSGGFKHKRFRLLGVYATNLGGTGNGPNLNSFDLSLMFYFGGTQVQEAAGSNGI